MNPETYDKSMVENMLEKRLDAKLGPVLDSEEDTNTESTDQVINIIDMSVGFQGHSNAGLLSQNRTKTILVPKSKKRHDRIKPIKKKRR